MPGTVALFGFIFGVFSHVTATYTKTTTTTMGPDGKPRTTHTEGFDIQNPKKDKPKTSKCDMWYKLTTYLANASMSKINLTPSQSLVSIYICSLAVPNRKRMIQNMQKIESIITSQNST